MAEATKLTESEAVRVRAWLLPQLGHAEFSDLLDRGLISSWSALGESGSPRADITDLGRAALAAYDAEQRERIERDFLARTMVVESGLLIDTSSTATEAVDAQSVARRIERAKDGLVRKIRIAAMRECEILVEKKTQYSWRGGQHALRSAAAAIRLLIAKEESNG